MDGACPWRGRTTIRDPSAPMRGPVPLPAPIDDRLERAQAQLRLQAAVIRAQAAMLADSRAQLDRVSEAAQIGIWECSLPDERLRWTDGVYDLFDLPRDCDLDRGTILGLYERSSRAMLTALRSKAIAEGSGFTLDAQIVTPKGHRRWIRLTATVEREGGRPVRLFGMKQDITEGKLLFERNRRLAESDAMTGLANRSRFEQRMLAPFGALLLVDLDGFKRVNDTHGHAVGDACLKVASERLARICGEADLTARIGGDEFAVILAAPTVRARLENLAGAIVDAMREPVRYRGLTLHLGASVGIALAQGAQPAEVFAGADAALYAAKAAGRNTFRWSEPRSRGAG